MKACVNCGKKPARIRFCSNKCKDEFHNRTNPRGKFGHLATNDGYHESGINGMEAGWDAHKGSF